MSSSYTDHLNIGALAARPPPVISGLMISLEGQSLSEVVAAPAADRRYATPSDWENVRHCIKRLYVDEDKTLKEVMSIMAQQYGHHGTTRMYKKRITSWALDKNHKENEMLFILHKKAQRDAAGKQTSFSIRKRKVTEKEAAKYFRRKNGIPSASALAVVDPHTPKHVSYRTPSPPPAQMTPLVLKNDWVGNSDSMSSSYAQRATWSYPRLDRHGTTEHSALLAANMPRQITSPTSFHIPEELFFAIGYYCNGLFDRSDPDEIVSGKAKTALVHFDTYCDSAFMFITREDFVQARRLLSRACAMIRDIVAAHHVFILRVLFNVFLKITRLDKSEIFYLLVRHIYEMGIVLGDLQLTKICRLVANVGKETLNDLIAESIRCSHDHIEQRFGRGHEIVSESKLNLIQVIYIYGKDASQHWYAENLLRKLLLEQTQAYDVSSLKSLEIKMFLGRTLYSQERFCEVEALGLEIAACATELGEEELIIRGTELVAHARAGLCQFLDAKASIQDLVSKIRMFYGDTNPDIVASWITLEKWLRNAGLEEDADEIMADILAFMGPDDLDNQ